MNATDPDQIFLQEAQDLLEQLEQTLLDLERTPADSELIDTAFRAMHTIKGSGAMFGFDAVAAFTHHVETAFDLVRKGELTPTRELIAVALAAKDQMRVLIDDPAAASASAGDAILGRSAAPGGRRCRIIPHSRGRTGSSRLARPLPAARGRHGDRNQSVAPARRTARARHRIGDRADHGRAAAGGNRPARPVICAGT